MINLYDYTQLPVYLPFNMSFYESYRPWYKKEWYVPARIGYNPLNFHHVASNFNRSFPVRIIHRKMVDKYRVERNKGLLVGAHK